MGGFVNVEPPLARLSAQQATLEHRLGGAVWRRVAIATVRRACHQLRQLGDADDRTEQFRRPFAGAEYRQGAMLLQAKLPYERPVQRYECAACDALGDSWRLSAS